MTAIELRHKCIARMVTDWVAGLLDDRVFEPDAPSWFKKNKIPGTYADHVFLTYISIFLGHDLVIIHMTPNTVENSMFRWVKGKALSLVCYNLFKCLIIE